MTQLQAPSASREVDVRNVLSTTTGLLGPTEIARRINKPWCMPGGEPSSSAVVPVLRRIGAISRLGKYTLKTESPTAEGAAK